MGSIPGLGRSPEEGNGNPLQYSCREERSLVGYCPWDHQRAGHELVTKQQMYNSHGGQRGLENGNKQQQRAPQHLKSSRRVSRSKRMLINCRCWHITLVTASKVAFLSSSSTDSQGQIISRGGSCRVNHRMHDSFSGLYPWDAGNPSWAVTTQNIPRHCLMFPADKTALGENHCSRATTKITSFWVRMKERLFPLEPQ